MKALVVTADHQLELWDIPAPEIGQYEALVRIRACGICSTTDRELIKGTQSNKDYPCLLGHEAVGEVVEVGGKVTTFHIGDIVTRPVAIWPGTSQDDLASAWGGFAEYGFVRDRRAMMADGDNSFADDYTALRQNVVPTGVSIPDAVLAISLAETSSWFHHLPPVGGKTVCIAGTGIAGLSMVLWSKLAGAKKVIVLGRRKERCDLACELAADHGVNIKECDVAATVKELTDGAGADFFLEAVGKRDQIHVGLSVLAPGGHIAIYGAARDQQYDLEWSWGPYPAHISMLVAEEHLTYQWAIDMLRRGHIPAAKLMTHSWPLAEYETAFQEISEGKVVKGFLEM